MEAGASRRPGPVGGAARRHSPGRCLAAANPPPTTTTRAVEDGSVRRIMDEDIQSSVLDLRGSNVSTSYITCPADPAKALGVKLPYLVLVVKNLHQYFTFEVQIIDSKGVKRRFRASNFQVCGCVGGLGPWVCQGKGTPGGRATPWCQVQGALPG